MSRRRAVLRRRILYGLEMLVVLAGAPLLALFPRFALAAFLLMPAGLGFLAAVFRPRDLETSLHARLYLHAAALISAACIG